jgi:hypothetical protein
LHSKAQWQAAGSTGRYKKANRFWNFNHLFEVRSAFKLTGFDVRGEQGEAKVEEIDACSS